MHDDIDYGMVHFPRRRFLAGAGALALAPAFAFAASVKSKPSQAGTTIGVSEARFTLNGTPAFLFGISYYGALGASRESIAADLDDIQRCRFNWIRVWATWSFFADVSAVDVQGRPRQPFFDRLKDLLAECDRRGLVVDVTLTRGEGIGGEHLTRIEAYERAVGELVRELKPLRNWYLDLANEHDIGGGGPKKPKVSFEDLVRLRNTAKAVDPARLVTASYVGDAPEAKLRRYLNEIRVDFLSPHRYRHSKTAVETEGKTREALALMKRIGRVVPVHYQEPFRHDFSPRWQPAAQDFITDLKGALDGGAAGWCFHNGDARAAKDGRPRRSFDLREQRLFAQLDEVERQVLNGISAVFRQKT